MQNWIICLGKITYWLAFSRWKFDLVYTFFLPAAFGELRCWKGFDDVGLSISLASWQCSFLLLHLLGRKRHCCWKSRSSPDLGEKNMSGTDGQVSWSAVIRQFFSSTKQIDKLLTFFAYFFAGPTFLWDFTSWGDIYAYPPLSLSLSPSFCWRDMIISSWAEAEKERRWFFYFISD